MKREETCFVDIADVLCISYMSAAVIKYHKQDNIYKKEFTWAYNSNGKKAIIVGFIGQQTARD